MKSDRTRGPATRSCHAALKVGFAGVVLSVAAVACAPKRVVLPTGPGTPAPDYRAAFDRASEPCTGVRTLKATMRLSGRAGGQRMRGTLVTGMEAPDAIRLEGVAPFGAPAFILVARGGPATLLLPRDNRFVTGVSAADILEALAGIRIDPATLRALVAGCVVADVQPVAGRLYPNGWIAVDIGKDATAYLRQVQGEWRIVAGLLPGLEVQYGQFEGKFPAQVHVLSRADRSSAVPVDLTLVLSDISTNVTLSGAVFAVDIPPDAVRMTLAELRDAGPLGEK